MTGGRWTTTEEMIAWLVELQDEQNRITFAVATGGKRHLREPFQVPRPYTIVKQKASAREIARFFGARRAS